METLTINQGQKVEVTNNGCRTTYNITKGCAGYVMSIKDETIAIVNFGFGFELDVNINQLSVI